MEDHRRRKFHSIRRRCSKQYCSSERRRHARYHIHPRFQQFCKKNFRPAERQDSRQRRFHDAQRRGAKLYGAVNRNGTSDTAFVASANANVSDFALYQDGQIFLGGDFTAINGFPSNRVARLYPDGRLDGDTISTIVGGPAKKMLALPNGQTLIAGGFTSVGGAAREGMARIGWTGANDTSFANPQLTGGWTNDLAVQADGKYLVGGDFTSAGGTSQASIARFTPTERLTELLRRLYHLAHQIPGFLRLPFRKTEKF